jgi:hypothetical protein
MTVGHASPNLLSGGERQSNREAAATPAADRLCDSFILAQAFASSAIPIAIAKPAGNSQ